MRRLGLQVVGQAAGGDGTGGARRAMDVVRLDSLTLGTLVVEGVEVASRDYNTGGLPPIDGILCLDLFRGMIVTLDYPARRVRIERGALPEPDGVTVLAAEPGRRNLVVPLTVGGTTVPAAIDTGNTVGLLLPAAAVQGLAQVGRPVPAGKVRTVSGEYDVMRVELAEPVRLGGVALGRTVLFHDGLQVGKRRLEELATLRVAIDVSQGRVRLEPESRARKPPRASRLQPHCCQRRRRHGATASRCTGFPPPMPSRWSAPRRARLPNAPACGRAIASSR